MYKLTSLFIIILYIGISQQQCTDFSCATEGMKCTGDFTSFSGGDLYPPESKLCTSGYYCNNQNICKKLAQEGEACYENYCNGTVQVCYPNSNGCLPGLTCFKQSTESPATCQYLQYLTVGQECESTLQCAYTLECNQTSGLCEISQQIKDQLPPGAECSAALHCQGTQYCDNSKCVSVVDAGANCTQYFQCNYGTTCINNTCTPIMTVGEGGSCAESSDMCNVGENLYCDSDTKECTKMPPLVQGDCSDSSIAACGYAQSCLCSTSNRTLGQCESIITSNLSQCKSAYMSFFTCLKDNNSPLLLSGINVIAKPSSVMKNCYQTYCDLYISCSQFSGVLGNCNNDPILNTICSAVSSSPSNFLPSIQLFLFILYITTIIIIL
ncbi:hypothetical protein DLAC_10667 [Tieghemostelium lacteum]|uniref:Paramecium surface antigen repeat-containing protein n=1 Tax=Tieghemostelium lacteum TaxID=361077 RepID=A0A151Z4G3_TIELA|nr:hypothetical protein DLAC_10667 [Tieghemostelium lacteum]|eukprot:KYQ88863.1 hypothetical protein DLAC_10667 [Tieghemostelium lacteum]